MVLMRWLVRRSKNQQLSALPPEKVKHFVPASTSPSAEALLPSVGPPIAQGHPVTLSSLTSLNFDREAERREDLRFLDVAFRQQNGPFIPHLGGKSPKCHGVPVNLSYQRSDRRFARLMSRVFDSGHTPRRR
ncbi:hypothetical protein CGCSCA5_v003071 [Colletotrichum siamense]|nr:hypothetical protein CGCSCA5_v003071 [Colletotrichum siamense]KAF4875556.1 hypothetical protein CGCSCA1_v005381 [Colletotrichum siamense]